MASKLLLPGFGGTYTTTFSAVSLLSTGSDTIDCTRCYVLALTLSSTSTGPASANAVTLQQSFDGVGYVQILTAVTAGSFATFPATGFPYGIVRIIGSVAVGSLTVGLTGFPLPTKW